MELIKIEDELNRLSSQLNQLAITVSMLTESKYLLSEKVEELNDRIKKVDEHIDKHEEFMISINATEDTTKRHISYLFKLIPSILIAIIIFMIFGDQINAMKIAKTIHDVITSVF